ncbi:MAG: DUF1446 domain-containing protein [Bacteroidales bacterium]|nr:DUF1446 domain-containing protein [Bacteroidales bacterium]
MKDKIRIGNAGGFWGDDLKALRRQLEGGDLDYISSDYLAEITMSILRKQQSRDPKLGYVTDFVDQIVDVAPLLIQKNVRMLTNAGGMNPLGCAREILKRLKPLGISLKIAVVDGDNIVDRIEEFYPTQSRFENMESGEDFSVIKDQLQSANAYLGVPSLLKALETGAQLILAGRVTDTSITMAPMIHEFGWKLDDWDKLATGLIAGHIIECGAQSTGGNYTDWEKVDRWDNFAYPVVEVYPDSSFIVTRQPNTGGLVNMDTVKEQLLYEMGEPGFYISPDVIVDFRTIQLEEQGLNQVKVYGVKGMPSTRFLKVSMAYYDGFKASGTIIISGGNALKKARKFKEIFWERLHIDFEKHNTEFIGYNACHQDMVEDFEVSEILLRFSVFDKDRDKIIEFGKNIAPIILSGPPGVAVTGGRPRPQNVMTYWPALVPKDHIDVNVRVLDESGNVTEIIEVSSVTGFEQDIKADSPSKQLDTDSLFNAKLPKSELSIQLSQICLARSGDKGDMANIGVVARNAVVYQYLKENLTAKVVKDMFGKLCKGAVIRFELDNLQSLNFLLEESLDGGGTKSLMIDAQGKTFASALLNQKFPVTQQVLDSIT